MTEKDKRSNRSNVYAKTLLKKQSVLVEYYLLLYKKHLSFAQAHLQNTKRYHNQPGKT